MGAEVQPGPLRRPRNAHCLSSPVGLSDPILHDTAIPWVRYPISRDTFYGRLTLPQNGAIPPFVLSFTQAHLCHNPFALYRAIIVQCPIKASTKEFCDTIATNIARYEKYRCWASNMWVSSCGLFCVRVLFASQEPNIWLWGRVLLFEFCCFV